MRCLSLFTVRKAGLRQEQALGAASLMLAQGESLRTVMEQLGHSQIHLTANTYSHIAPVL